jgi:hypothetical protein
LACRLQIDTKIVFSSLKASKKSCFPRRKLSGTVCISYKSCENLAVNFPPTEGSLGSSVPDPWHFGVDTDPGIHASDKWIRIRILDPDPDIFVLDLQDASKKLIF